MTIPRQLDRMDPRAAETVALVCELFPATPRANIAAHLPAVWRALDAAGLDDAPMRLMALATIRAETEGFVPIDERRSRYNTTAGGPPFDRYDHRADLGNQGPPDGARFRGRGFVQLTGRANYARIGGRLGIDLVAAPERANEPDVAARILACFLAERADAIRAALAAGDLRRARRLVNGGSHGLPRFADAYERGAALIA